MNNIDLLQEFDAEGFRRIDDDGPDETSPEDTEDSPQNIERRRRLKEGLTLLKQKDGLLIKYLLLSE